MEREKMIEEMAKKVCIACGKCKELKADCYLARNIASVMIDDGYRKVPDGAVVLTKEECDSKVILDEDHFQRVLDNEREKARKEIKDAVNERTIAIIKDLIGHRFAYYMKDKTNGTVVCCADYVVDEDDVKFLEEKYKVEVKE